MYTVSNIIRTCKITPETIRELEKVILEYIGDKHTIKFEIVDNFGKETISTFQNYEKKYFSNNIKQVLITGYSENRPFYSIAIDLNKNSMLGSDLKIELESKERALGCYQKLCDIFNENSTLNWIFRWDRSHMIIHLLVVLILTLAFTFVVMGTLYYYIHVSTEMLNSFILPIVVISGMILFFYISKIPHTIFKTKRSEDIANIIKTLLWLILAAIFGLWLTKIL